MNELEQKKAFALALMRDRRNPFAAALSVFGTNTGAALRVYLVWAVDPDVLAEVRRLEKTHGKRAFLPDAEDIAQEVHIKMQECWETGDRDTYNKLLKQYNEVMGFIKKPGVTVNNGVGAATQVMEVQNNGSDDQWEKNLVNQQGRLTDSANDRTLN